MTLVGKIFTLLTLFMSVAFMMLAVTIFATHRNWKEMVVRKRDDPAGPGLKIQIEDLSETNKGLRVELERAGDRLAIEQAARRFALAALQSKLEETQQRWQQREMEFANLQAAHGRMVTTLETNEENMKKITEENAAIRTTLRQAEKDRDEMFEKVVVLTDQLHQSAVTRQGLEERQKQLVTQAKNMKMVLDRNGLSEFTPVGNIPPRVDGVVTAVGEKDLVEISIGSDDGLRQGHTLEVYRNNSYLGRVVVKETWPDRAVVAILKEFRRGVIKKGDRVATKFS